MAGGAGLRWGEAAGLCADAVDLDAGRLRVIRTVVEVAGHTRFKGYPKSAAGRRSVPLPGWLVETLCEHVEQYRYGEADLLFGNEVGAAHRRTNFRARVWRPSLVRAGLLGAVTREGDRWVAFADRRRRPEGQSHHGQRRRGSCRGRSSAGGRIALSRPAALGDVVGR